MLLAQISDTHITVPGASGKNSEIKLRALENCVENINSLNPLPDAVIHTGDLSHNGTLDELELVKRHLKKLKAPYFVTPGNRDCNSTMLDVFADSIGKKNLKNNIIYAVKKFPINLVSFDTTSPDDNLGVLNFEKISMLDNVLSENQKLLRYCFRIIHCFFCRIHLIQTSNAVARSQSSFLRSLSTDIHK